MRTAETCVYLVLLYWSRSLHCTPRPDPYQTIKPGDILSISPDDHKPLSLFPNPIARKPHRSASCVSNTPPRQGSRRHQPLSPPNQRLCAPKVHHIKGITKTCFFFTRVPPECGLTVNTLVLTVTPFFSAQLVPELSPNRLFRLERSRGGRGYQPLSPPNQRICAPRVHHIKGIITKTCFFLPRVPPKCGLTVSTLVLTVKPTCFGPACIRSSHRIAFSVSNAPAEAGDTSPFPLQNKAFALAGLTVRAALQAFMEVAWSRCAE